MVGSRLKVTRHATFRTGLLAAAFTRAFKKDKMGAMRLLVPFVDEFAKAYRDDASAVDTLIETCPTGKISDSMKGHLKILRAWRMAMDDPDGSPAKERVWEEFRMDLSSPWVDTVRDLVKNSDPAELIRCGWQMVGKVAHLDALRGPIVVSLDVAELLSNTLHCEIKVVDVESDA